MCAREGWMDMCAEGVLRLHDGAATFSERLMLEEFFDGFFTRLSISHLQLLHRLLTAVPNAAALSYESERTQESSDDLSSVVVTALEAQRVSALASWGEHLRAFPRAA